MSNPGLRWAHVVNRMTATINSLWIEQLLSADSGQVSADSGRVSADSGRVSADRGRVSADRGQVSADIIA